MVKFQDGTSQTDTWSQLAESKKIIADLRKENAELRAHHNDKLSHGITIFTIKHDLLNKNCTISQKWEFHCHWCDLFFFSGAPFHKKFLTFHKHLTKHYEKGGAKLYNPDVMEKFCHQNAPGLFYDVLQIIRNDEKGQMSKRREETQRQRVVAILHQFSYFRNQVSW